MQVLTEKHTQSNNPIQGLVDFESRIQQLDVDSPVNVQFSGDGQFLQFTHKGLVLNGEVDRPLIHQLGGRAWGQNQGYKTIFEAWKAKFQQNRFELAQELAEVFSKNELCIRYSADAKGQNQVYGIVTPHFIDVNQLEFRARFVEQARQSTALVPDSEGFRTGRFGEIIEYFRFDNPGLQTEFKYGLVYARNNGYEGYKVDWQRYVLVCKNGLKRWEGGNKFAWKHTKEVDLSDFITKTVADGIGNQTFLEERIAVSRDTPLQHNRIGELMARLSLASASKARVTDRLAVESKAVGYNEWALSQALTWLGSHEKAVPPKCREQLTGLGTDVLEHSVDEILEEESQIYSDGSYGLLLPKGFRRG